MWLTQYSPPVQVLATNRWKLADGTTITASAVHWRADTEFAMRDADGILVGVYRSLADAVTAFNTL